jgi:ribosome-associated toxin RatA of RatAB toxin-antitoxin module
VFIFRLIVAFLASSLFFIQFTARADSGNGKDIAVQVKEHDGVVIVDVALFVPATVQESWKVLTDYDHMAQFIPTLKSNKVIATSGNKVRVSQQGSAGQGPLSFPFESVREITLNPHKEIRSRLISGSMKKLDGLTQLRADGVGTRILYHGEFLSNVLIPPAIGSTFIENEVREQYEQIRQEILRRKRLK